jgi:DNA invertase Pin-like site-specific DNA recombinase
MMVRHVCIYARFSTSNQDERSIDDQIRRCRKFAEQHGYVVTGEYKDEATSGAHLDRVDFQRLLADARRRGGSPFNAVVVDDTSRLSRDLGATWRVIFEDLASVNVAVIDQSTGRASTDSDAWMSFGMTALMNHGFLQMVKLSLPRFSGHRVYAASASGRQSASASFGLR